MQSYQSQTTKKGSPVAAVIIAGFVVVVLVTGMVLYFYRDVLRDANQRSTIGGCINDVFRASSDTAAELKWDDGELQLPTMDARSTIKSELPDDLSQFSFLAAVCCTEGGEEISTCAEALRGFVDTHPDATKIVSDDAASIKEFVAVAGEAAVLTPDSAEAAIAAVIAEGSVAKRLSAAFELMESEDDGVRATAMRAFYGAESPMLRRAAVIRALEQTESGNRKLLIDASVPEAVATASSLRVRQQQILVDSIMGRSLSQVKIDRATGAFSAKIDSRCDGTVTNDEVMIFARGWTIKLKPDPASPVLRGTYTRNGRTVALSIRLM